MVGQGAGPSRRSHTKSRKGCKTCKRRHIRCDETFPQCKNCTKHQVRCDYLESVGSDTESQHSPEQSVLSFSPMTESRIEQWQNTGSFPYPELQVFPPPPTQEYSTNELRLIHHLTSISDDLRLKGTSHLTIWAQKVPKFLSIAASYPYVMHALLSFSANNLAWTRDSNETRQISIHHGTVALRGLHEAIGSFSHANADAVLAASLLLLWQATDWRSWSSLRAGISSVLSTMDSWKQESIFAEFIHEENLVPTPMPATHRRTNSFGLMQRDAVLLDAVEALQRLQVAMINNETEYHWAGQLLMYVQRLQAVGSASSPEEQFEHLYMLRKWLFWVPVALLQPSKSQGSAMLTIAHFYAVALVLEPLFPELGSSFCARAALGPLESILSFTDAVQSQFAMDESSMEIAALMQYPRQAAYHFRNRCMAESVTELQGDSHLLSADLDAFNYTTVGNLSPAFAPVPLHFPSGATSSSSSFLEVPMMQAGFSFGTQGWGAAPSPGFPPEAFTAEMDDLYNYDDGSMPAIHGGFTHQGGPSQSDGSQDAAGPSSSIRFTRTF